MCGWISFKTLPHKATRDCQAPQAEPLRHIYLGVWVFIDICAALWNLWGVNTPLPGCPGPGAVCRGRTLTPVSDASFPKAPRAALPPPSGCFVNCCLCVYLMRCGAASSGGRQAAAQAQAEALPGVSWRRAGAEGPRPPRQPAACFSLGAPAGLSPCAPSSPHGAPIPDMNRAKLPQNAHSARGLTWGGFGPGQALPLWVLCWPWRRQPSHWPLRDMFSLLFLVSLHLRHKLIRWGWAAQLEAAVSSPACWPEEVEVHPLMGSRSLTVELYWEGKKNQNPKNLLLIPFPLYLYP